jgi:phospholipid transport system transporter-binding protein
MPITNDSQKSLQKRCFAEITLRAGVGYLSGALTVETVPSLYQQTKDLLEKMTSSTFDLKEVTQSDSSGVALLLVWTRFFRQQAKAVSFINVPNQMLAMIRLTRLTSVIPIK